MTPAPVTHAARARRIVLFLAGGVGALILASPALPRTVEYLDDMATIRAAANDQGITGPFSEKPGPGVVQILLETPTAADHRVTVASVYCQAYGIDNPVSVLLQDLVKAANQPPPGAGAEGRPNLLLRIISSSTVLRCLGKNDLQMTCKNRVRIAAEASVTRADGSSVKLPLIAQVEREGRVGGFCGNIARYTGIVTREAGIDLIRQARAASAG
jgi:hypothetical protein